jgi:hypothetical protein
VYFILTLLALEGNQWCYSGFYYPLQSRLFMRRRMNNNINLAESLCTKYSSEEKHTVIYCRDDFYHFFSQTNIESEHVSWSNIVYIPWNRYCIVDIMISF